MNVSQFMTSKLVTARPHDGVRSVFFKMRQARIRHIPVVTGGGQLVGWISDRDLRRPDWADPSEDLAHAYQLDDHLEARDVMNPNPVVVRAGDPITRAVDILEERHFGALPVLDKRDDLVGVLSAHDLLGALKTLLAAQEGGDDA
jgi:acetoin utilization protein AcuB